MKANQKKYITPIELIDSSKQQLQNTIMIKKMINSSDKVSQQNNMIYGGGYKYQNKQQNDIKEQKIDKKINKLNVYDEFGLLHQNKSIKNNDNQIVSNNNNNSNFHIITSQINNKIDMIKENRNNKYSSLISNQQQSYYNIANQKNRHQIASHVKSSLNQFTLENVQARLLAHRSQLKPIQQAYNKKIGKTVNNFNRQNLHYNINVNKQYQQMNKKQDKIYKLIQTKQKQTSQERQLEELWEEKKKQNPKLAQYDRKYQQYLVQKEAKNIISHSITKTLYTWDKYCQQDHEHKSKPLKKKDRVSSIGKSKNNNNNNNNSNIIDQNTQDHHDIGINDLKDLVINKDDKFIGGYIMKKIDIHKKNIISKEELYQYISQNQHFMNAYNIDIKWLYTDIDNYQTERKGILTKKQIIEFLVSIRQLKHPQIKLQRINNNNENENIMNNKNKQNNFKFICNFKQYQQYYKNLFEIIDIYDDKIIKRQQYIQQIYQNNSCSITLNKIAIKLNIISKNITFKEIISYILNDYRNQKNLKIKNSKQYISFNRFKEYFEIPQNINLHYLDNKKIKQTTTQQYKIIDIDEQYLILLKDIYCSLPHIYQDYIISIDFIQTALKDPQILIIHQEICRLKSIQTNLPVQSIATTLHRMMKQTDQYITWEDIQMFLSRRGRPFDWSMQLIQQKKLLRKEKQIQNYKKLNYNKQQDKIKDNNNNNNKIIIKRISAEKYTIPQPFDIIDQKNKNKNKNKNKISTQLDQYSRQFKANPINRQILEPKPNLIFGKKQQKNTNQQEYQRKYENYENDRIERALKKAQEQYEIKQKIMQFKRAGEVKATGIGIDLTKKYHQVIKDQNKNKKNKTTIGQIGRNLYPENPVEEKRKKMEKNKEKEMKMDQATRKKQQQNNMIKEKAKIKNQEVKKHAEERQKRQEIEIKERKKNQQNNFKPKINERQITEAEKQASKKAKQEKQRKKKQTQQRILQAQEQRKKKVLAHQKQQNTIDIKGLNNQEIIERIENINFEDLLLNEEDKREFRKQYDLKNKTRKQIKQKYSGQSGRERKAMQVEDRRLMKQNRKQKQAIQENNINEQAQTVKGDKVEGVKKDLVFNRSKALRRYRAIMENKEPLSQFDRYSVAFGPEVDQQI